MIDRTKNQQYSSLGIDILMGVSPSPMTQPSASSSVQAISVKQLASRLDECADSLQLLDVREPQEIDIVAIDGFQVIPLSQFSEWAPQLMSTLDPHQETIVLCHHGIRSAQLCQWLVQNQGFTNVYNVVGGIDAYAATVDSTLPRY